ncbi:MAG TPA: hypothetical protein ENN12_01250 [Epsilonproteobacteria bacterium]|nr:hypothetical protein [Campylobacterota bacterium]
MSNQTNKDKWQEELEIATNMLLECQQSKNLKSCFDCDLLFDCETRSNYVKVVYESMNKGQEGDFEF